MPWIIRKRLHKKNPKTKSSKWVCFWWQFKKVSASVQRYSFWVSPNRTRKLWCGQCMLKDTCLYPQASAIMLCNLEFHFSPSIMLCSRLETLTGIKWEVRNLKIFTRHWMIKALDLFLCKMGNFLKDLLWCVEQALVTEKQSRWNNSIYTIFIVFHLLCF